ncbi:phosphoglucomutase [Pillotina sp. SPG140]|jgi:phosphoglucomutase
MVDCYTDIQQEVSSLILSTSGWRGIFGNTTDISKTKQIIVGIAAYTFSDYIKKHISKPTVLMGRDTRPTGHIIADSMLKVFISEDIKVHFAGITAAPEIMSAVRNHIADCFVFISASHNPVEHNGLKFGLSDGGVIPGSEAHIIIDHFRALITDSHIIERISSILDHSDPALLTEVYAHMVPIKQRALEEYLHFTETVIGPPLIIKTLNDALQKRKIGIVCDFNGSARAHSIDQQLFKNFSIDYAFINPDAIVHRIVPEGESLEPCRLFLEEQHKKNDCFVAGYVPDCDGDRGNLVIWDSDHARILEAQEVFALACVGELAQLVWTGELSYDEAGKACQRVAVVVNDPTSLRIDRIAEYFGVTVFRTEVGEANVVGLARQLRSEGWIVRIVGEGSAGGTIIHPSFVRDPLDTVFALVKLLTIRDKKGLFELWCERSHQPYRENFSLVDICASLPPFVSTGAYSPEALLHVESTDHALLKKRYQSIFCREWELRKKELATYGIESWDASAFIGQKEYEASSDFSKAGRGGLKILFKNRQGKAIAVLWMRGSGTESVFRIMAESEGTNAQIERTLIQWHRAMVLEADQQH